MLDGFIYSLQLNDSHIYFDSISGLFFSSYFVFWFILISCNNESFLADSFILVKWKEILYKHLPVIKMQQIYFGLGSVSPSFQENGKPKQKRILLKQVVRLCMFWARGIELDRRMLRHWKCLCWMLVPVIRELLMNFILENDCGC